MERLATSYADGRVQLPVLELVVVLAQAEVGGRVLGHTSGAELDTIALYLGGLVTRHELPEKVFVFHPAPGVHAGFKLFYDEDARRGKLMTPAQVLALRPRPELVTYE